MAERRSVPPDDLKFADLVVAQGLCSREKVDDCVDFLSRLIEQGVTPLPKLGELLVRRGHLASGAYEATLRPSSSGRAATSTPAQRPVEVRLAEDDPSSRVGRYVKVSRLGSGGMGEVWKGWDTELGRWVALKFMKHDDPNEVARFRREAQTAARLNHPNIASIYEVGESGGRPFIAMQYIAGATLGALPRDDARRLVELSRDAALAIHHAHEQGVVHRDLKPANLMVEEGTGRIYVMDFGLAKPTTVDSSLSASGAILGTPAYMSPEQARGDTALVGPANDVYSLGATLYELLTNRPPFQESEIYALLRKVVDEDPPPVRRLNPRVNPDLETIVLKCLEKEPDRRYASAQALAEDLVRWLKGEAIEAHPPSLFYKARKFVSRRKAVTALAAVVAAVVGLLVPFLMSERSERRFLGELGEIRAQMLTVKEWTRQEFRTPAEIRAALAQHVGKVSAFVERHPDLPQGYYVRAHGRLLQSALAKADEDLRAALSLDPSFAPAWLLLARIRLEEYDRHQTAATDQEREANRVAARQLLLDAQEALRRGWSAGSEALAIDRWGLARTPEDSVTETLGRAIREHHLERRTDEAIRILRAAQVENPSPEYCRWLAFMVDDRQEKSRWHDLAVRIAPHSAGGYTERGLARIQANDIDGAMADYDRAIEIDPDGSWGYVDRAVVWSKKREFDKAVADCTRAIELDPGLAMAWSNRAGMHVKRGDFAAAERDATEAIRLSKVAPYAYANRAGARMERGDLDGAIADADEGLKITEDIAVLWSNRAAALMTKGDFAGARKDLDRALKLDPDSAEALGTRSGIHLLTGDSRLAVADADRAIALDPTLVIAYVNRAGARCRLGQAAGALEDAEKAVFLRPGAALAYVNRAYARLLKNDTDGALEDTSKAIELDDRAASAYVTRSTLWRLRDKPDKAMADAQRALDLAPSLPDAHAARAAVYLDKEDYLGALSDATKAIELGPGRPEFLCVRGLAHEGLRQRAAALADYEKALEVALPGSPVRAELERLRDAARRP
jgi:serine/threonine-protein kinase